MRCGLNGMGKLELELTFLMTDSIGSEDDIAEEGEGRDILG